MQFCPNTGTVTKTSRDEKLKNESAYYSQMKESLKIFFPRKVSSYQNESGYNLILEYFGYPNLGNILLDKEFDEALWIQVGKNLRYVLEAFGQYEKVSDRADHYRKSMFIDKTEREYNNLFNGFETFKKICANDHIVINGKRYENFSLLWPKVKTVLESINSGKPLSVIHGDLCFSNILCDESTGVLRMIDPRGAFGEKWIYGDPIYDAAKLLHSTEGNYESIIYDRFKLSYDISQLPKINFSFDAKPALSSLNNILFEMYPEHLVRMVMGTIFIGMCARHYDSLERQIVMYCTGIKALTEALS